MQVVDGVMKTNVATRKDLSDQHLSKRQRPSSMEGGRGCTVRLLIGYFETLTSLLVDRASSHLISTQSNPTKNKSCARDEEKFAGVRAARSETKYSSYKKRKPLTGNVWNLLEDPCTVSDSEFSLPLQSAKFW